jgi:hypothetical protein
MKIHPLKAATFASSTRFSNKMIEYLKRRMLLRTIESMSYANSGPSSINPTITAQLNIDCLENHTSLAPTKLLLAHSFSLATRSGGSIESLCAYVVMFFLIAVDATTATKTVGLGLTGFLCPAFHHFWSPA